MHISLFVTFLMIVYLYIAGAYFICLHNPQSKYIIKQNPRLVHHFLKKKSVALDYPIKRHKLDLVVRGNSKYRSAQNHIINRNSRVRSRQRAIHLPTLLARGEGGSTGTGVVVGAGVVVVVVVWTCVVPVVGPSDVVSDVAVV